MNVNGLTPSQATILYDALGVYRDEYSFSMGDEELATIGTMGGELREFLALFKDEAVLEMWTDGAARPTNPGPAGIGVVGKLDGRVVIEVAEHIGRTTNNVAEYLAAVTALKRAIDIGVKRVHLHSDSKLVVNQFSGEWACKDDSLMPLLGRLRGLAQRFDEFTITWISRRLNREADGLSVAGAYATRACGACGHAFHTSFCLIVEGAAPEACGCPYGFRKGLE
jgi:ribonuclease HI